MFNTNLFLSQIKKTGLAKPNYFEVYLSAPSLADNVTSKLFSRTYCKSAAIPGVTLNYVEVPYKGMYAQVPTTRVYQDWSLTIINDANYILRTNLEKWSEEISSNIGLPKNSGISIGSFLTIGGGTRKKADLSRVFKDLWVIQYSNAEFPRPTAIYKLVGAFPLEISNIDLNWDANDSTEDYQVTFRYQYFERLSLSIGNSSPSTEIISNINYDLSSLK